MSAAGDLRAFPADISGLFADRLGLTKRELFAAMAMAGFAANSTTSHPAPVVAGVAVRYADYLIAELSK